MRQSQPPAIKGMWIPLSDHRPAYNAGMRRGSLSVGAGSDILMLAMPFR